MMDGEDCVMVANLTSQPFTSRRSKTGSGDGSPTSRASSLFNKEDNEIGY